MQQLYANIKMAKKIDKLHDVPRFLCLIFLFLQKNVAFLLIYKKILQIFLKSIAKYSHLC